MQDVGWREGEETDCSDAPMVLVLAAGSGGVGNDRDDGDQWVAMVSGSRLKGSFDGV